MQGKLRPPCPPLVSTKARQMPTNALQLTPKASQRGTLSYIHIDLHKTVPTSSHLLETAQCMSTQTWGSVHTAE